jgi:hypothetical protein
MTTDATGTATTSPEVTGSETTSEQTGTAEQDPIALARKRQAGAEAARQIAEKKLADQQKELDAFRVLNQTQAEAELSELAREKALREAAEKRAADATTAAEAKVLDKLYPKARAEYPEVVDEAKLAKLEALLDDGEESPTPRGVNGAKGQASTGAAKEPTIKDIEAQIKAQEVNLRW